MFIRSFTHHSAQKSTIVTKQRHRLSGSKQGRTYNYAYRVYGPWGYGIGKLQPRKDRSAAIIPRSDVEAPSPHGSLHGPLSDVTRSLSKEWIPYALEDGGVLFTHPTTHNMLRWSHETLREERRATGLYSTYDADRDAKIKTLLARNTIEAQPLESWRRKHIVQLLRARLRQKGI